MVAYFRRQNQLFMLGGAVVVLLALAPFYRSWLPEQVFYARAFYVAIPAFAGGIAGRIGAAQWANRKLRKLDEILYRKVNPKLFIREFAPLVEKTPTQTAEYVNGRIKLAYAYEAMGEFEKSLEMVRDLKPEELPLHVLSTKALLANQLVRVYLLQGDVWGAEEQLEKMKKIQDTASARAPALASNLRLCIRLAEVWLGFLQGKSCEEEYITEEMNLAKNAIHKSEMRLLLAKMKMQLGEKEKAGALLRKLTEDAAELYSGKEAMRILDGGTDL